MSDKPKTIQEALELVRSNKTINEQEPGYSGRSGAILNRNIKRDTDSNTLGVKIGGRVARTDNTPERNPEKQETLARSGEFLSNFIPAAGAAAGSIRNAVSAIRAARAGRAAAPAASAASSAPAALPKPATTGASSGASTAPAARPATPGGSATPPPKTVGSSSTAGPGYTPTGGVGGFKTNTPSSSLITPGRVAGGLATAGAAGGAAYIASRSSGEKVDAKESPATKPPGTSGATMPGGTAKATGFGLSGPQSSAGAVATPTTPAPKPAAKPAAPAPKPAAAPAPDPNATSKAMFQRMSDKGDDATSADFFAADRQRTKELRSQKTNEETKMSSMVEAFLKLHKKESYDNLFSEAKKASHPDTPKEKELAALGHPKDKITHKDVLIGRGVLAKESSEGTAGAVKRDGKDVVSPTAPGGSGYKKEGPSDADRAALNKKIDKIVKEDSLGSVRGAYDKVNAARRDKEPGVTQYSGPSMTLRNAGIMNAPRKPEEKPAEKEPAGKITDRVPSDKPYGDLEGAKKAMGNKANEEVEFSEAELEHIAAIMEISVPASPVADDYTGSNHGVSKRDLTDETISETKKKDPSELKQRGRKAGVKVGAYKKSGEDESDVSTDTGRGHPLQQIRDAQSKGNTTASGGYNITHKGQTKEIPGKEARAYYSDYHNAANPRKKEEVHNAFLNKHFGSGTETTRHVKTDDQQIQQSTAKSKTDSRGNPISLGGGFARKGGSDSSYMRYVKSKG